MNKVTLITGASAGIGEALAYEFASHGHNLVLVARTKDKLEELKHHLEEKYKIKVYAFSANLFEKDSCAQIISYIRDCRLEIECLINNAGMGDGCRYDESDWAKDEAIIQLNILTLMHMCRVVLPIMREAKSGTIVNIASTLAFAPTAGEAVYSASKAFVLSFGQSLFEEMREYGVHVLTICPGVTDTDFFTSSGFELGQFKAATPESFAGFAYKSMKKGKALSIHRFSNQLIALFSRLAPRSIVRKSFANVCKTTKANKT